MDVTAMQARCRTRFRDLDQIFVLDATWLEHLNAAYSEFYQAARWPFRLTSSNLTLAAGTHNVDLTTGQLEHLQDVYDSTNDRALIPVDEGVLSTRMRLYLEAQDSKPIFYRIAGEKLNIFPAPLADATISVWYHQADPVPLAAGGDVPVMPVRYHEALVSGALAKAHNDDLNVDMAKQYRDEFMGILEQAYIELRPKGVTHEWLERRLAINRGLAGGAAADQTVRQ